MSAQSPSTSASSLNDINYEKQQQGFLYDVGMEKAIGTNFDNNIPHIIILKKSFNKQQLEQGPHAVSCNCHLIRS